MISSKAPFCSMYETLESGAALPSIYSIVICLTAV
jgi:hypothetical protein